MKSHQHLAAAEVAMDLAWDVEHGKPSMDSTHHLLTAIAHALIANAIEAGVFHPVEQQQGGSGGV